MPNIRLLIYITLFTTLVFVTQSISQPADVYGWKTAKWGMNKEQILKEFGSEIEVFPEIKKRGEHFEENL